MPVPAAALCPGAPGASASSAHLVPPRDPSQQLPCSASPPCPFLLHGSHQAVFPHLKTSLGGKAFTRTTLRGFGIFQNIKLRGCLLSLFPFLSLTTQSKGTGGRRRPCSSCPGGPGVGVPRGQVRRESPQKGGLAGLSGGGVESSHGSTAQGTSGVRAQLPDAGRDAQAEEEGAWSSP